MPDIDTLENRRFAEELTRWFQSLPPDKHDWAEALLAVALDEHKGDGMSALEDAKQAYSEDPDGP